ncbi:hypothetical protein VTN77DRAFT_8314 [Rasamsonia byssochlamydoides]|uniref:uncharacterized protein n=1 Tax=Rasamsonia byssochlamydoides TaxID=89139 RepID=UPI0037443650
MFRSAAEISSSDPESSSDESDNVEVDASDQHSDYGAYDIEHKEWFDDLDQSVDDQEAPTGNAQPGSTQDLGEALDLDADGHATVMTSALLEFYCFSRAADILNAQPGSHGRFTRDSPEAKYLGRKMFAYKSQFLSSHGIMAGGVDSDEWGPTRQYYRDSLDMLGITALDGINLGASTGQPSSRGAIKDAAHKEVVAAGNYLESKGPEAQNKGGWDLQKRIPGNGNYRGRLERRVNLMNLLQLRLATSSDRPAPLPLPSPLIDHSSRYAMEFSEIKVLGRGSFGQVYEVRNHVDGQNYAVKKIPLSKRRLEMLQQGGIHHIEHIMKEIRTLARLEHANVVRYYSAWVEQAHTFLDEQPMDERHPVQSQVEMLHGDDADDEQSFGIVFEKSEDTVSFEDDSRSASTQHRASRSSRLTNASNRSNRSNRSKRSSNRSNGDDDDDVESIPRNFSIPSRGLTLTSTWDETEGDIFTDGLSEDPSRMQLKFRGGSHAPAIILHIQMSLHPLTLSTYLNPQTSHRNKVDRAPSPRHCFHLLPSLKLLLGILSGVEYLHSKGIVHRDLKPANIFLSVQDDGRDLCPKCKPENGSTRCAYLPRIGDFGLVADISREHCVESNVNGTIVVQDSPRKTRHVGTEFYCPPMPQASNSMNAQGRHSDDSYYIIDEKLDVFALGMILFELVYRLNTKMERQMVLFDLTRGGGRHAGAILPADFEAKVDCGGVVLGDGHSVADSLSTCIKGMLEPDSRKRWRCADVRRCLESLVSMAEKNN